MNISYNYMSNYYENGVTRTKLDKFQDEYFTNIVDIQKYFKEFIELTIENKKEEIKINDNLPKKQKELESECNSLNNLKSAIYEFSISCPDDNIRKSVSSLNDILSEINRNTNNSLKNILGSAKKEQQHYLKEHYKKGFNKSSKKLKSVAKDKKIKNGRAHVVARKGGYKIDLHSDNIFDAVNKFVKSANNNFNFLTLKSEKEYKNDVEKSTIEEYAWFQDLLNSKEVYEARTLEKTEGSRRIDKIELNYNNLLNCNNREKLLEKALEICNKNAIITTIMPKTVQMIQKEYDIEKKELMTLKDKFQEDSKYLRSLSFGKEIVPEEKDIINKTIDNVKKVSKNTKDAVINIIDEKVEEVKGKKEENQINELNKQFEKIVEQKISELDDSLSYSVGSNFKKFKDLSEEKQAVYKENLETYLQKRVCESGHSKALMDAKFEVRILDTIYGVKKDVLMGITEPSEIPSLDPKEKEYFYTYVRKLDYIKSETMFRKYESDAREIYRHIRSGLNSHSPLEQAALEIMQKEEIENKGRSL